MSKLALLFFLLPACSLVSVNNCDEKTLLEVQASDWPSCQKACLGKDRPAYGSILYSREKAPEFRCVCGDN